MIDNWGREQPSYPEGVILFWTNPISEIPPGWAICDGNNGTPDLMDKYPKSVPDSSTDPGTSGGSNIKNLSASQLPSHNHSVGMDTSGEHRHQVPGRNIQGQDDTNYTSGQHYNGTASRDTGSTTVDHNHSLTTDSTGNSNNIDNRPLSFEVIYIQKI